MAELISGYSVSLSEQRVWLEPYGKQRLKRFEDLLKSNPEGAICEALTRKVLSDHEVEVEPYEDLSSGGPDFRCTKDNRCFYLEVTCISKDTATKKTGLSAGPPRPSRVQRFGLLTKKLFYELCNKGSQCANLDEPCIIAICTLHFQDSVICFRRFAVEHLLTGTSKITMKIDPEQGRAIGDTYQTTDLVDSAFIHFQKNSSGQVEFARNPISAILLCGFGCRPPEVVGALHPNPNHQFDRTLLPNIEFGRIAEGWQQTGQLKVQWI